MFTYKKVAQMAAFFADKEGAPINVMKLMKLMYLTDRESMRRYGYPITLDTMVSMRHGPVLSRTLDLINGFEQPRYQAKWDEWISDRCDRSYSVALRKKFTYDDLDRFSKNDWEVLNAVWDEFGAMDQWELSGYTHKHCVEWCDPGDSSAPIKEADVLMAVGRDGAQAARLAQEIIDQRALGATCSQP